jgi:tetratricopeptide (TPR) repeat protein
MEVCKMETRPFDINNQTNPLITLKKALASYDETINIINELSSDNENNQTLAYAYINRGDVLQALEQLESDTLEKALLSYEKAIHLAKTLPSENAENRKILAEAYMKRGNVLRVTGSLALETKKELAERQKRYSELAFMLREQIENGDAEYDERVGSLLEQELEKPL